MASIITVLSPDDVEDGRGFSRFLVHVPWPIAADADDEGASSSSGSTVYMVACDVLVCRKPVIPHGRVFLNALVRRARWIWRCVLGVPSMSVEFVKHDMLESPTLSGVVAKVRLALPERLRGLCHEVASVADSCAAPRSGHL